VRADGGGLSREMVRTVHRTPSPRPLPRSAGAREILTVLVAVVGLASCASAPRGGAPGAPIELSSGYPELRARFDADAGRPRLLVLASPT
jgi:hypothetical protein